MTAVTLENNSRDILSLPIKAARRSSLLGSVPTRQTSATGSTPIAHTTHHNSAPISKTPHHSHSEPALFNTNITDLMILGHHNKSEPKIHSLMIGYEVKNQLSKTIPKASFTSLVDKFRSYIVPKESQNRYAFYTVLFLFFVCNAVYDVQNNFIPFLKDNFVNVQSSKIGGEMVLDVTKNIGSINENKRIMQETDKFIDDSNMKENLNSQDDIEVIVLNKDIEGRIAEEEMVRNNIMVTNKMKSENDKVAEMENRNNLMARQEGHISPWYLKTNRDLTKFNNKYYKKVTEKKGNDSSLLRSNSEKDVLALRNADNVVNTV